MKHDFLKHYDQGQDVAFEDKPLNIIRSPHVIKYEISVKKFGENYDFQNSEELVNDFLNNVHSKFKPTGPFLIKCGFIIENIQQSVPENLRPILNIHYWSTDACKATYFNDYVFYSLKQYILSKVIGNGMSGSS